MRRAGNADPPPTHWYPSPPSFAGVTDRSDAVQIRLGDPPLADDAFVNQRLAVGGESGDLGFEVVFDALRLRELRIQESANGLLILVRWFKRGQINSLYLVENCERRVRRETRIH